LNEEAKDRKGNSLKQAAKFLSKPGIISLGGGLPSSEYFPFAELSIKVPQLGQFSEDETEKTGQVLQTGKHDLLHDKSIFDISTALNYGQGSGAAQLVRWVTEHTELVHNPPYADWACNVTVGSTSALDMAFRMFCQRGDYIISEEYTFSAAVETAAPMGVKVAGVKMDEQGLLPSDLDHMLSTWDPTKRNGARKPFLLYTVPSGQNPTGATQGAERRRAIYRVAQKHDLYILEDEPYYFLQMEPYNPSSPSEEPPAPSTHEAFLKSLVPSYLSMDVDGRVMRLDSFSKVLGPGLRTGWITASHQITERYRLHADVSTQCPSGVSQLVLFKLLDECWGHDGFLDWLIYIRLEYTKRRNVILQACEKYLPKEFVSWQPPAAGMFHWLKIEWTKHPRFGKKTVEEIEEEIFMKSIEKGALVMRGSWFYAEQDVSHETLFFRATYAAAPADRIEEAIRRFGDAVRESFGIGSDKEVNGHGGVKRRLEE
jgi:aromatic amino acid aminotransferase I